MANRLEPRRLLAAAALGTLCGAATPAVATVYSVTPLVTDSQEALAAAGFGPARAVDPNLVNPWGMSFNPQGGPFWVSNQASATSTLYDGEGNRFPPATPLVVTVPGAGGPASGPTGQVFAGGTGLTVPGGAPAAFLFANLDGSISAWTPNTTAATVVVPRGTATGPTVYTGLAITGTGAGTRLFAANNAGGRIDVYDASYQLVSTPGAFVDPGPNPDGLVPFNVKAIGDRIYVTYAPGGPTADEAPLGTGFVSVFNPDGSFVRRIEGDQLVSPWGLAIAPDDFGEFSNALLVGNFSEELGYISAFDAGDGNFLGLLEGTDGEAINIPDLWELLFGNDGLGGDADDLYFSAGIGDELHGLFGEIAAQDEVPEPAAIGLLGIGLAGLAFARRRTPMRPA